MMPVPTAAETRSQGWSTQPAWTGQTSNRVSLLHWTIPATNTVQIMLPTATAASLTLGTQYYWPAWQQWQTQVPAPVRADRRAGRDPGAAAWLRDQAERDRLRAEQTAHHAEALERRRERRARLRVGEARARGLLVSCLSEEQRAEFAATERFHVVSDDGRLFRIEPREVGNLIEVDPQDRRREVSCWCVHPRDVPIADVMLSQKLWLETDSAALLAVANRHR